MSVTSESYEKMMEKYAKDSPSSDDANSRGSVGGNGCLKKGPWTSAEDAILVDYITKHGEGNWNTVQKHTGLARCGKSCRLRWANHLKPDLKKGAFSPEEEHLIIELHAKMGNKWARMAAELPGRTDNEIKNYWNTRVKRRQRAGLPIYPPDICFPALNENQQKGDTGTFSYEDVHYPDYVPINNFQIPPVEFKNLEVKKQVYSPPFIDLPDGTFLNIPANSLLEEGLPFSHPNKPLLSTLHPSKCLHPGVSQYENVGYVQNAQSFMYSSTYDHNLTCNLTSFSSVVDGNNAFLNGNSSSSSDPNWAMKMELPSDQTQVANWGTLSSPLPPLESIDTLIQTPPTEHTLPCHLSPRNSGLLDAVLHESQTMRNSRNGSHHVMNSSSQVIHEKWWDHYGELTSLGHSSSLSEGTTPMSGISYDGPEPVETIPGCTMPFNAFAWLKALELKKKQTNGILRKITVHDPSTWNAKPYA